MTFFQYFLIKKPNSTFPRLLSQKCCTWQELVAKHTDMIRYVDSDLKGILFLCSVVGYGYSYQAVSVTDLFTQKNRNNIFLNLFPINFSSPLPWPTPFKIPKLDEVSSFLSPKPRYTVYKNSLILEAMIKEQDILVNTNAGRRFAHSHRLFNPLVPSESA